MIAPFIIAAAILQPASPATSRAAKAPPAPVMQWDSAGFTPPRPSLDATAFTEPSAKAIERLLQSGGLLGGGANGGRAATTWLAEGDKLTLLSAQPQATPFRALPVNWLVLDEQRKESAFLALTIDANALRTSAEALFDAPWLQRILDRLALNNARLISLRAAIHPAPADDLLPLLELKAVASARSEAPDKALTHITLIAPGWGGTPAELGAIKGANWAASLRADSGGLGRIGRDGGVGTWAGLTRLAVDIIGTAQTTDTAAWAKEYHAWQERTTEELRTLNTRLQSRGTLACFGSAAAPDLVLIIPGRKGEQIETLTKAMDLLGDDCGFSSKASVWTAKAAPTSPLTPKLAITVSGTPSSAFLILTLEHSADHALLQETAARLRSTK